MAPASLSRRHLLIGTALGAAVAANGSIPAYAQNATPIPQATPGIDGTPIPGSAEWLAVADPTAKILHFYQLPEMALVGQLDGIAVNTHAGFIPLPDGALLFMDDLGKRLVSVSIGPDGVAMREAPIAGTAYSHIAIDSDHAHLAAVGSDDPAAPITLVNLETWETTPVPLPEAGEVGLMLTHDVLFHRNDVSNQIEAHILESVLAGLIEPVSTVQIGAGGHGESISTAGDRLYTATDDGIDTVTWNGTELTFETTFDWASADRTGGRGYFQRLSLTGQQIVSYTADRTAPETEWTAWTNEAVLIDLAVGTTNRIELGTGYVYRFGLGGDRALFYRLAESGDEAIVLNTASGDLQQRIALEPMSTGPVPGTSIYETNQYRAITSTTDGRWGFVTQGGDGKVVVLDLDAGAVVTTIAVDSPLDGGGYLAVFGAASSFTDTIGR